MILDARTTRVLLLGLGVTGWLACGDSVEPVGPVASVTVTPADTTLAALSATVQLTAIAEDADGNTVEGKEFSWTSSDGTVASVSASGLVTAAGNGTATITATTDSVDGTASVSVNQAVAAVDIYPGTMTLTRLGQAARLYASANDASGAPVGDKTFYWWSSDDQVATVNDSGRVTAIGEGTATVTASVDGVPGAASVTVDLVPRIEVTPAGVTPASPEVGVHS